VSLSSLLTRRAAIIAAASVSFRRNESVGASVCAQKCKKKKTSKKEKLCIKKCEKKEKPPVRQPIQRSGVGPGISDSFYMAKGRYIATSSITTTDYDNFIIDLYGPGDDWDLVVNEIPDYPGSYQYKRVVEAYTSGTHFLEIEYAAGSWSIVFTPA
jgi:hypothetical protein